MSYFALDVVNFSVRENFDIKNINNEFDPDDLVNLLL